jgi:hypothetical protein
MATTAVRSGRRLSASRIASLPSSALSPAGIISGSRSWPRMISSNKSLVRSAGPYPLWIAASEWLT